MEGPVDEAIRLFALCDAMRWAHLPVAGGLYDQDPELLDRWQLIFQLRAAKQRNKDTSPTPPKH